MPLPVSKIFGTCVLCERDDISLTAHHLIPRKMHKKKKFRKQYSLEEMIHGTIDVCRRCHVGIHKIIPSEATLAEQFNRLELLKEHPTLQKHIAWVKKQKG